MFAVKTHWGRVTYICVSKSVCLAQSHYLNQWWLIVDWSLRKKYLWILIDILIFSPRKCIWQYLPNGCQFVSASVCLIIVTNLGMVCENSWYSKSREFMSCEIWSLRLMSYTICIHSNAIQYTLSRNSVELNKWVIVIDSIEDDALSVYNFSGWT